MKGRSDMKEGLVFFSRTSNSITRHFEPWVMLLMAEPSPERYLR